MARKKKNAGVVPLTSPQTREEHYLANIAGLVGTKPEYPFTRTERYLDAISSSSFSPTESQLAAINSGATAAKIDSIAMKTPVIGKGVNLLDNWYFIGGDLEGAHYFPINQRGSWSFWNVEHNGYFIDRWYLYGSAAFDQIYNLVIKPYGSIDVAQFWQKLNPEVRENLDGKTITASLVYGDGSFAVSGSAVYDPHPASNIVIASAPNGLFDMVIATDGNFYIFAYGQMAAMAVKLELGDTQTLYHMENGVAVLNDFPNYPEELQKCQRYCLKLSANTPVLVYNDYAIGTNKAYVAIFTPVKVSDMMHFNAATHIAAFNNGNVNEFDIPTTAVFTSYENSIRTLVTATGFQTTRSCIGIANNGGLLVAD
ncbi:MAG: hypothetical protein J6S67_16985 [Methanobrevibacter sp.]|nr:hypothetical protein [Methanobrevibacter sp.]